MTAYNKKGKAIDSAEFLLCEGKKYSLKDVCEIIRKHEIEPSKKGKKK